MNKETKLAIYTEVQRLVKEDSKVDISIAEIHSIVESQFKIMMYGFSKDVGSALPIIGKFIPFDMNTYAEEVIIPNKELQRQLTAADRDDEARAANVKSYAGYRKLLKNIANQPEVDAMSLISIPNVDGSTDGLDIFKEFR